MQLCSHVGAEDTKMGKVMNYKNIRPYFLPTLSLVAGFMLSGCAGGVSTHDVAGFDSQLKGGNYPGAAASAVAAGKIAPDGKSDNLLWSLNAGAAMVYAGDPAHAIPVLDNAKDMIDQRTKGAIKDKGQYSAKTYDGVMLDA
jgi:hypothetical protein